VTLLSQIDLQQQNQPVNARNVARHALTVQDYQKPTCALRSKKNFQRNFFLLMSKTQSENRWSADRKKGRARATRDHAKGRFLGSGLLGLGTWLAVEKQPMHND